MKRAVGMPRGFLPLVMSSVTLTSAVAPALALELFTATSAISIVALGRGDHEWEALQMMTKRAAKGLCFASLFQMHTILINNEIP